LVRQLVSSINDSNDTSSHERDNHQ
jgi:hypothetical protein